MYLLPHELARLRRRRLSLASVFVGPLDRFLLRHGVLLPRPVVACTTTASPPPIHHDRRAGDTLWHGSQALDYPGGTLDGRMGFRSVGPGGRNLDSAKPDADELYSSRVGGRDRCQNGRGNKRKPQPSLREAGVHGPARLEPK